MPDTQSPATPVEFVSALSWTPKASTDRALRLTSHVVTAFAFGLSLLTCFKAGTMLHSGVGVLPGAIAWFALLYAAVAAHELGHFGAAKLMGMHTLRAHCGPVQLMLQDRGFRWRFKQRKGLALGSVLSLPDPRLDIARQLIWFAAGGPLASLLAGLAFAVLGVVVLPDGALRGFAYAFSILSLGFCVSNLVPSSLGTGSDGLRILQAWRLREDDPGLAPLRLNGLALAGTTADLLPPDELEKLRSMPQPAEFIHLWFVLKGLQNQLRWDEAAALAETLERAKAELKEPMRKSLQDHFALLDCEIRFSSLMAGLTTQASPVQSLTLETDWISPHVRPRCLAAMAAVGGDAAEAHRWLSISEEHASRSPDAAARISEGRLRDAIRAMADRAAPTPSASHF